MRCAPGQHHKILGETWPADIAVVEQTQEAQTQSLPGTEPGQPPEPGKNKVAAAQRAPEASEGPPVQRQPVLVPGVTHRALPAAHTPEECRARPAAAPLWPELAPKPEVQPRPAHRFRKTRLRRESNCHNLNRTIQTPSLRIAAAYYRPWQQTRPTSVPRVPSSAMRLPGNGTLPQATEMGLVKGNPF